jgi:hypothetical protein
MARKSCAFEQQCSTASYRASAPTRRFASIAVLAVQINLWVATIRGRGGLGDASGATIVVVGILSIVPLKIAPSSIRV